MKNETIFWDIDTQYDFIMPDGKLYVKGAENILDNISNVRRFALDNGYSIIASMDWHSPENPEISENPDFEVTFPPHCMAGEPGTERVGELGELQIDYLGIEEVDAGQIKKIVEKDQFHVVVKIDMLDLFVSPNTIKLIGLLMPKTCVVFGVALDICVYHAVKGLKKYSDASIYVVKDAVKGLGKTPDEEVFEDFKRMGAKIIGLDELKGIL
jgi:nicotinamidase/pyrazinamidase